MTKEVINKTTFHLTQEEKDILTGACEVLEEISNTISENDNDEAQFFASPIEIDLFGDLWVALEEIECKVMCL